MRHTPTHSSSRKTYEKNSLYIAVVHSTRVVIVRYVPLSKKSLNGGNGNKGNRVVEVFGMHADLLAS